MHSGNHIGHRQPSKSRKRSREQEQGNATPSECPQKRLRANENLRRSSREWKFSSMEEADAYLTSHGHSTILEIANKYLLSQGHPLICIERTQGASLPEKAFHLLSNGNTNAFQ